MKDNELLFDRKSHVLYSKPCKNEIQATTCVNSCRCDYTIYDDQDPYVKDIPNIGMRRASEETNKNAMQRR